ncbi:MAG: hypothetical protein IPN60_15180, partial [Saprospiraceae bacterium]|nr:hypothetical protein [Candidatus Opimibacter skivensis]
ASNGDVYITEFDNHQIFILQHGADSH